MKWSYKLPIMPLVDEAVTCMDDVLVADPITTTTTTTTATTTNSNNNINNPNSIINVDSFDNNNGNNNSSTNGAESKRFRSIDYIGPIWPVFFSSGEWQSSFQLCSAISILIIIKYILYNLNTLYNKIAYTRGNN